MSSVVGELDVDATSVFAGVLSADVANIFNAVDQSGEAAAREERLLRDTRLVRKQYHFWRSPSGDGIDAWDVDRLIELSADLPVSEMPVASFGEIDTVYWFDGDRHQPTVRAVVDHVRLIHDVDTSYPIILGPDGRVMDGMHRIARAVLEDRATISAVTFSELPDPDHRDCDPNDLSYDR